MTNEVQSYQAVTSKRPEPVKGSNGAIKVASGSGEIFTLASAITSVSTQTQVKIEHNQKSIECLLTGTGAISATVLVYGAHTDRNTNGTLLGTLSPSGTTTAADSLVIDTPWLYIWTDTTAISGTSAAHNTTVNI